MCERATGNVLLMLLVLLFGVFSSVRAQADTFEVGYDFHTVSVINATPSPPAPYASSGLRVGIISVRIPAYTNLSALAKSKDTLTVDTLVAQSSRLRCGSAVIETVASNEQPPQSQPFLSYMHSSADSRQLWFSVISPNNRLPALSRCVVHIDAPLLSQPLSIGIRRTSFSESIAAAVNTHVADRLVHSATAHASLPNAVPDTDASFLEADASMSASASSSMSTSTEQQARIASLLSTMQTLRSAHGGSASQRIVWQLTLRGLAISVRQFMLSHLQESYYQILKGSALPFLTELICTGEVEPITQPDPVLPEPEEVIDAKEGVDPAGEESSYAGFVETDVHLAAREADAGDDSSKALKPKPSTLFNLVSWIAGPITSGVEPAISDSISDVMQTAVAMNIDDKLKRVVNGTVARMASRATTTLLTERLAHALGRTITQGVVRRSIPGVVQEVAGATLSSLSHALPMTLTRSLTRDPKLDVACSDCGQGMSSYSLEAAGANKACNECKVSTWNDYYMDYYTSYYTQYYYGYYGHYYTSYFSRVFAEEQLAKLEQDVAAAEGGE